MFKIEEIVNNANETTAEIPEDKDLNLIDWDKPQAYAAAMVITEDVNGTGCCKSETHIPKTPPWVRRIQGSINGIRKDLSALAEIKGDEIMAQNMKERDYSRNIT